MVGVGATATFDGQRSSVSAVELVLTAACNLRCDYCFQRRHPAARMSWETLRASVDLLAGSPQPELTLAFYGGEPLLEPGLLNRGIEYARTVAATPRQLRLHVTTNGLLLDRDLAAYLASQRVAVRLSFDGVAASQERRGISTFARLDHLLASLGTSPDFADRLSVHLTLTGENLASLADSVDYFIDRRVRTIVISPRLTPDPDWSPERERELDSQLLRVRGACLNHYARTGRVSVTLFRRSPGEAGRRAGRGCCNGGRGDGVTVDVDGRVTACAMFAASYSGLSMTPLGARLAGLQLGYVTDPDLGRRLAEYPAMARATGLFDPISRRHSRCRRCPARHECLMCPAAVAAIPDNDDPHAIPPLPCAFNRIVAKHRALFPVQPSIADIIKGRASPLPRLDA